VTKDIILRTKRFSPWPKGTLEKVNNDLNKLVRSLLSEWQMESSQWPLVLPVTQSGGHGSLVKVFDFDLNSETQVCLGRKNRE